MADFSGYFITWTTHGTRLPGDERGWSQRGKETQESQPALEQWWWCKRTRKQRSQMKTFLKVTALTAFTLLVAALLFVAASQLQKSSSAAIGTGKAVPIVGIWKGQHGQIIDLRRDGTARVRSTNGKSNNISYSTYRLHGDELSFYSSAKPDEYLRRLSQIVRGVMPAQYAVAKLSNSELQLINSRGETEEFERIEDSVLSAAP